MHSKYFLLILLLSIYLRSFSCALNCSEEAFDCGVVAYIAYPFWGGDRPSECGREGFKIVCLQGNIPILKISSLSYIIRELDFSTNSVIVARQDLHDTYCPQHLHNTTIDHELFKYPPKSTDRNLTLYFDCAADPMQPNSFSCANRTSNNLFKIGDGDASSSSGITSCNSNIYVPVKREDAESLQNPTASSINILHDALTSGFSIQWFNDSRQILSPFCNANVYGSCIRSNANIVKRRKCDYLNNCGELGVGALRREVPIPSPAPVPTKDADAPVPSPAPLHIQDSAPVPSYRPMLPPVPPPAGNGLPPLPISPHPLQNDPTATQINHGKNLAKEIVLVVPLTVAGMIIASISIHCFLRRRRLVTGMWKHDVEKLLLQQGSLTPKRYRYSEIKKITKSFTHKLGQGGYGSVYKGMLPNACHVAVKVLMETADSNGEEFINEVASICRTSHVNIVNLLGFCYEGNKRALVYEFMPNSSLDKFLNHNQSAAATMDLEKLYKIAVGIAKGLEYLHIGCTARIVHFDIKPQNILLDEDFCPKISDFGLAKLYKKKQSLLSVLGTRGTAGYIAPEVFSRNFGGVSHKSDVYSYGMMLLEMAGAKKATPVEAIQSSENYFPDKIYEEVLVDDLMMMEGEGETRKKMFVVGFWCIQTIPSSRPSISKVVEMLEGEISSIQIPPKPFLFSPDLPRHETLSSSLSAYVETQNSAQC